MQVPGPGNHSDSHLFSPWHRRKTRDDTLMKMLHFDVGAVNVETTSLSASLNRKPGG